MNIPPSSRWACLLISTLACGAAGAQVQRCQVEGRPVFQSAPCALEARPQTGAATAAAGVGSKKKSLDQLLQERDGADRGQPRPRDFERDGAMVLRTRMGAV
ncbi:MAG: hypothetical protein M3O01_11780 [Pseudomonadota bacterium]|nr:hypothetical protein [Pseudomonadota bacterium]